MSEQTDWRTAQTSQVYSSSGQRKCPSRQTGEQRKHHKYIQAVVKGSVRADRLANSANITSIFKQWSKEVSEQTDWRTAQTSQVYSSSSQRKCPSRQTGEQRKHHKYIQAVVKGSVRADRLANSANITSIFKQWSKEVSEQTDWRTAQTSQVYSSSGQRKCPSRQTGEQRRHHKYIQAVVKGSVRADRLVNSANITSHLRLRRSEVLRSLRLHQNIERQVERDV